MTTLKVVVSDHWFDKIKSGRKTHEYRICSEYWIKKLTLTDPMEVYFRYVHSYDIRPILLFKHFDFIEFQRAYRKNPERMTFKINNLGFLNTGAETDLKCDEPVFDIELGERIEE